MRNKGIGLLALLLCAALLLPGCAAREETGAVVTIWHTFTDEQEAYLQTAAGDFSRLYPNIEVRVESQPGANFTDVVYGAVAGGVGPDIIFHYASEAARYPSERLLDLSQYIDAEQPELLSRLGEGQLGEVTSLPDGLVHYLPAYTTGPVLYYNKTLFDELSLSPPETLADMASVCETIYAEKGVPGLGVDCLADLVQMLIFDAGASYIDVQESRVGFDTPEVRERIAWLCEQARAGRFLLRSTADYFSDDFSSGLCAAYIGSCAHVPYITPDGFEYDIAPVPASAWVPSWNRGPIAFSYNDDTRADACWAFIRYFLSPDVSAGWAVACSAIAPYADAREMPQYQAFLASENMQTRAVRAVEERLPIAGTLPSVRGAAQVRAAIENAVIKAALGDTAVDEAWDEAVLLANAALAGD